MPEGYQKAEGEYFIIPDRENGIRVPDGAISIENAGTPHVVENIKNSGTLKLTKDVNGRESGSDFRRPISTLWCMTETGTMIGMATRPEDCKTSL